MLLSKHWRILTDMNRWMRCQLHWFQKTQKIKHSGRFSVASCQYYDFPIAFFAAKTPKTIFSFVLFHSSVLPIWTRWFCVVIKLLERSWFQLFFNQKFPTFKNPHCTTTMRSIYKKTGLLGISIWSSNWFLLSFTS